MSTLFKHCSNIRKIARAAGAISDDDQLQLKQIAMWLDYYRAKNIDFATDRGKESSMLAQIQQVKRCIDLKRVDIAECKYKWNEKVLKVSNIPRFLDLPDRRAILYVGTIDGRKGFQYADPSAIDTKMDTRFGHLFSYYYFLPNKKGIDFYVVPNEFDGGNDLRTIMIRGIAATPSDWDDCIIADLDMECSPDYPLLSGSEVDIIVRILNVELGVALQTATDLTNNALHEAQ